VAPIIPSPSTPRVFEIQGRGIRFGASETGVPYAVATDFAKAMGYAKTQNATAILDDELPIIYFGHQSWIWAFKKSVTGFVPSPDGMIRLVGVKNAG